MNDIIINVIGADDLHKLAELYVELTGEPSDLQAMTRLFDAIASNPSYFLLGARVGGVLVGSAMGIVCHKLSRDCRPFMIMENFVVAASHRRMGVGAKLIRAVEDLAVEQNCCSINFTSSRRRPEAHVFYATMGYELDAVQGFRKQSPSQH